MSLVCKQHAQWCRAQGVTEDATGKKVVPRGLEPRTLRLLAVRSNQLSYETIDSFPTNLPPRWQWATVAQCQE